MGETEFFKKLVDRLDAPVVDPFATFTASWVRAYAEDGRPNRHKCMRAWRLLRDCGAGCLIGEDFQGMIDCLSYSAAVERSGADVPIYLLAAATWGGDVISAACGISTSRGITCDWIAVSPAFRLLGVGRRLVGMFHDLGQAKGLPVYSAVPESHLEQCAFFRRCGWSVPRDRPTAWLNGQMHALIGVGELPQDSCAIRIAR